MLKFSMKQGRGLDFTNGLNCEDELNELEILTSARSRVPEDVGGFRVSLQNA